MSAKPEAPLDSSHPPHLPPETETPPVTMQEQDNSVVTTIPSPQHSLPEESTPSIAAQKQVNSITTLPSPEQPLPENSTPSAATQEQGESARTLPGTPQPSHLKASPEKARSHPRSNNSAWSACFLALVTICLYALTVCYAFGSTSLINLKFLTQGPSLTLAALRTLSEATSLFLLLLISLSTETILWTLLSRSTGMKLSSYLSLQANTTAWGNVRLLWHWARGAKVWSFVRIVLLLAVPVLGVILLLDATISLDFQKYSEFPVAAGIGAFNASYGRIWTISGGIQISMLIDYTRLFQDTQVMYPVASVSQEGTMCSGAASITGSSACLQSYFLTGGTPLITPWPTRNNSFPDAPAYFVNKMAGLQFDFGPLDANASIDEHADCILLGIDNYAVQICISQYTETSVNAKYVSCINDASANDKQSPCLSDLGWTSSPGWTTKMQVYSRHGDVAFWRANQSIISVNSLSEPQRIVLSAVELLNFYNTTLAQPDGRGFGSSVAVQQLVIFIATLLVISEGSPASSALPYLQNLLALPFYYLQPTYMSPFVIANVTNAHGLLLDLPASQGLYTTAAMASPRYRLFVAKWTAWVYTIGTGLIIVACIVVVVLRIWVESRNVIPELVGWPSVDLAAECKARQERDVDGGDGLDMSLEESLREVKLAKKSLGPVRKMEEFQVLLRRDKVISRIG